MDQQIAPNPIQEEPQQQTDEELDYLTQWPYSPKFQDFADFIGLPADRDSAGVSWRGDPRTAQKMEDIYNWAKVKINSDEHDKILDEVNNIRRRVGTNSVGKDLVNSLWRYVKMNTSLKESKPKKKMPPQKLKKDYIKKEIDKATKPIQREVEKQTRESIKNAINQAIKNVIK